MNTSKKTEQDLFSELAQLIIERDEDAPYRLSAQQEHLNELTCNDPERGKWIGHYDFPFLLATLALDDETFAEEFPEIKLSVEERQRFAKTLETHCENCARCALKRAYDIEWEKRVDRILDENKQKVRTAIARAAGVK